MSYYYKELVQSNRALAKLSAKYKRAKEDRARMYRLANVLTPGQWESLTGKVPLTRAEIRMAIDSLPEQTAVVEDRRIRIASAM